MAMEAMYVGGNDSPSSGFGLDLGVTTGLPVVSSKEIVLRQIARRRASLLQCFVLHLNTLA
jgi:hypothetical protein